MQKYKKGDKVKVVNYGHPMWESKTSGWKPNNILSEDDDTYTWDMLPSIVGQEGIIEGSYADLSELNKWGTTRDERTEKIYSIKGIKGKSSWYNESQLEMVSSGGILQQIENNPPKPYEGITSDVIAKAFKDLGYTGKATINNTPRNQPELSDEDKDWQRIGEKLTNYFGICGCQRKLKTIIDNLYSIYVKCNGAYEGTHERDFTGAEWLLIAILDRSSDAICHGVNCEYPIIMNEDPFWKWILKVKDNPNLKDN